MSERTGLIFDIRRYSVHDGPGIRTTVFFKGCPLTCEWCHNPESQLHEKEIMLWEQRCIGCGECVEHCGQSAITAVEGVDGKIRYATNRMRCTRCGECLSACTAEAREQVGRTVGVSEVLRTIDRDIAFFDESGGGVTFSGGEPLAQLSFLADLLQGCRALGIHTAVDTCGYAPWSAFERILDDTDLFLFDLKLMDRERHKAATGAPNDLILRNLQSLAARGKRIILRAPIVPGINDDAEQLGLLGAFAAGLPSIERLDILAYHPSAAGKYERLGRTYPLPDTCTPAPARMEEIADQLRSHLLNVKIGG